MIKADVLNKAGIDYSAGLERFMGDPELYEMVLAAFVRADVAERARAAYETNDRDTLLAVVHEAKGSSGNAGLTGVYAEASVLVALLRSGSYTEDALSEGFRLFETTYLKARNGIKAALS